MKQIVVHFVFDGGDPMINQTQVINDKCATVHLPHKHIYSAAMTYNVSMFNTITDVPGWNSPCLQLHYVGATSYVSQRFSDGL